MTPFLQVFISVASTSFATTDRQSLFFEFKPGCTYYLTGRHDRTGRKVFNGGRKVLKRTKAVCLRRISGVACLGPEGEIGQHQSVDNNSFGLYLRLLRSDIDLS